MTESENINTIKSIAWQLFPDCKVILFGSRARHENTANSDYDIMLIIDKTMTPAEKIPFRTQIRKQLIKFKILSDILIQSNEEIQIKSQLPGHIVKTILKEGIVI